jgi:Uma2 family endonuclease
MTALLERPKKPEELMRFSGQQYDQLFEIGFLTNEDRVELLDGQIIRKPEVNSNHYYALADFHKRLLFQFDAQAMVVNQGTIFLPQDGRPDPDIVLAHHGIPRHRVPLPEEIFLLIEVSDSTLRRDRNTKLELYARDAINEYWILNLEERQLEVYRDPKGLHYLTSFTLQEGQLASCLAFPEQQINWFSSLENAGGKDDGIT